MAHTSVPARYATKYGLILSIIPESWPSSPTYRSFQRTGVLVTAGRSSHVHHRLRGRGDPSAAHAGRSRHAENARQVIVCMAAAIVRAGQASLTPPNAGWISVNPS